VSYYFSSYNYNTQQIEDVKRDDFSLFLQSFFESHPSKILKWHNNKLLHSEGVIKITLKALHLTEEAFKPHEGTLAWINQVEKTNITNLNAVISIEEKAILGRIVYASLNFYFRFINHKNFRHHKYGVRLIQLLRDLEQGGMKLGEFSSIPGSDSIVLLFVTVLKRLVSSLDKSKGSELTISELALGCMEMVIQYLENRKNTILHCDAGSFKITKSNEEKEVLGKKASSGESILVSNALISRLTKV
jgi:hypothetical protein